MTNSLLTLLRSLRSRSGLLGRDKRGNVAVTFALAAVPLIALVGLGIDYYRGLSYKARLDAAADAAALAAINETKAYFVANGKTQSGSTLQQNAIAAGEAQGVSAFKANAGAAASNLSGSPTVVVTPNVQNPLIIDATVTYSAQLPMSFGGLVGFNTMNFVGTSASSLAMGAYQDFYLVLDVSGSMGLPTAPADQTTLAAKNPDNQYYQTTYPTGCQFACHFQVSANNSTPYQGFSFAETNNIQLRVDSLAAGVLNLINYANQPGVATFTDQYRFGVYPFIVHAVQAVKLNYAAQLQTSMTTMFTPQPGPIPSNWRSNPLLIQSTPLDPPSTQLNTYTTPFATTYLDPGASGSAIGSGGTHFENLWTDFQNNGWLQGSGPGTSSSPQGFIFLVTDGADNGQTFAPWTGSTPQLPPTSPVSADFCQSAKNAGYTVAVLLIPYVPIAKPNPSFAGNEDGVVNQIANGSPSAIQQRMQACASPGFFIQATSSAAISAGIQSLFQLASQQARLIQ